MNGNMENSSGSIQTGDKEDTEHPARAVETPGSFFLGRTKANGSPVELPVNAFKRHFMALGGSGSGKTVLCKCVIEEAVRNNVPVIIVDPQGDISSLAIKGNPEELDRKEDAACRNDDENDPFRHSHSPYVRDPL